MKQDTKNTLYVAAAAAGLLALLRYKSKQAAGVGKVERIKRRIYKEVSLAQDAGVDFSKKFPELSGDEKDALIRVGQEVGWKQSKRSIESGKSYAESYYGSLRRAWNAVSGVQGIGHAYNVKDADGNVCLTWIEDAAHHVEAETAPIVTEKPKAKKKTKAEEKAERAEFANEFIENWLQKHPNSWLVRGEKNNINVPIPNLNNITGRELLINEFANGTLKWRQDSRFPDNIEWYTKSEDIRKKHDWEGDDKGWITGGKEDNAYGQLVFEMIEGWKNRHITNGFSRDDLNDIRIALLDKAKHMELVFYDNETQKWVTVKGEDRYNYLDKINWIMMVHQSYHNSAADKTETTVYPIRAFNEKMEAELFGLKPESGRDRDDVLTSTRTIKLIPVFDVNVQSITGISGIGYVDRSWDERYVQDSAGNVYVTYNENYIDYLRQYGADEYDVLTAQLQVDNCGRVICYMEYGVFGYQEPVDNEYTLEELYNQMYI